MDLGDSISNMSQAAVLLSRAAMVLIAIGILYLAIARRSEPVFLLSLAVGVLLVNLPVAEGAAAIGAFSLVADVHLTNAARLLSLLLLLAIGANIDFGPLLERPLLGLIGLSGQLGTVIAFFLGLQLLSPREAAAVAAIASLEGAVAIYASATVAPHLVGPIALATFIYRILSSSLQPVIALTLTTRGERSVRVPYNARQALSGARVVFPIVIMVTVGLLVPGATLLMGLAMLGNLLREAAWTQRQNVAMPAILYDLGTVLLGLVAGVTLVGKSFLTLKTLIYGLLGLIAILINMIASLLVGKIVYWVSGGRLNPMLGLAAISIYPTAAQTVQRIGQEADGANFLLRPAQGINAGGWVAAVLIVGALIESVQR